LALGTSPLTFICFDLICFEPLPQNDMQWVAPEP
jgi:hypothetical protein